MTKLTTEQKNEITKLILNGYSARHIAKTVLGSESRKSTVSDFKKRNITTYPIPIERPAEIIVEDWSLDENKIQTINAKKGFSPEHGLNHPYPDGFKMGKTTIQRDARGNIERTWERMVEDRERQEQMVKEAIEAMKEDIPRVSALPAPQQVLDHLCNLYTITDAHVGMLAWGEESGDDWDISIASKTLLDWMSAAVAQSPNAHTGILCNLGDFLHFDGLAPVTPAHRHVLDADTRFTKMVRVSIQLIRNMVDMLLQKHQHVHVIMSHGNHDEASSIWLREMMYEMYKDEPRISVDRSPDIYYCYTWGDTTLFFHHGDKAKMNKLDSVLVSKFKTEFGNSKHVYAHTGHYHHTKMDETNLMVIEQHRTLAAKDAYSSRGGYMSGRDAKVITYHEEYGEVSRITINVDMLK